MALPAYMGRVKMPSSAPTAITSLMGCTSSFAANRGKVSLQRELATPAITPKDPVFCIASSSPAAVSATGCASCSDSAKCTLETPLTLLLSSATQPQPLPSTRSSKLVEPGSCEAAVTACKVALLSALL